MKNMSSRSYRSDSSRWSNQDIFQQKQQRSRIIDRDATTTATATTPSFQKDSEKQRETFEQQIGEEPVLEARLLARVRTGGWRFNVTQKFTESEQQFKEQLQG